MSASSWSASIRRRCWSRWRRRSDELGRARALVVHGGDGLDEITTTDPHRRGLAGGGARAAARIEPGALGIAARAPEELRGGDAAENAAIVRAVLAGEPGPRREIVLLNAAAALWVAGAAGDLAEGLSLARSSLDDGAARAQAGAARGGLAGRARELPGRDPGAQAPRAGAGARAPARRCAGEKGAQQRARRRAASGAALESASGRA